MNGDPVTEAAVDDIVTFTVEPAPDWALKENGLSVTAYDDPTVTVDLTQDANDPTKYTFTMPAYVVKVTAEFERTGYTYIDYVNGAAVSNTLTIGTDAFTLLTGSETEWSGWVVADGTVGIGSRVNVSGNVNLLLCDGATLTVNGGIRVSDGNSLTVYAQENGTGALTVSGVAHNDAGIGGSERETGGAVTINGGTIHATGGNGGAGIGGGWNRAGGTLTVNGGTVNATGGSNGAGIGGGQGGRGAGGTLIVNGGTVNATGGYNGAGIGGGGGNGAGGTVTVNGGTVNATGSSYGAGIGGNGAGAGGKVTINGGTVNATGGAAGAGIGGDGGTLAVDFSSASASLKASSYNCAVTVAENKVLTDGSAYYAGELSDAEKGAIAGKTLVKDDTAYIVHRSVTGQGTIAVSPSAALPDTVITFTLAPAEGWVLIESGVAVTYTDGSDQPVTITPDLDENGQYTFTMPDAPVTARAVFGTAVSVAGDIAHGSVTPDKEIAAPGDTVTLTPAVDPDHPNAFAIGTVSYNDGDEDHVIAPDANGGYSFTMPDAAVTVSATFLRDIGYGMHIYLDDDLYYSFEQPSYAYTGDFITPEVRVEDYVFDDAELTRGTDFEVAFIDNKGSADGIATATVTISGIGAYTGENEVAFRIVPGGLSVKYCTIEGTPVTYDTAGYGIDEDYLINSFQLMNGKTPLEPYTDYSLEVEPPESFYQTGIFAPGDYSATITGEGDWGGTKTITFTVIALKHKVVFDANGGEGTMADAAIANAGAYGGRYTLPECDFTPPGYFAFDHWEVSDNAELDGNEIVAPFIFDPSDIQTITVKACWAPSIILWPGFTDATGTCQAGDKEPVSLNYDWQKIPAPAGSTVTVVVTPDDPTEFIPAKPYVFIETIDGDVDVPVTRGSVVNNVFTFTFTMPDDLVSDNPLYLSIGMSEPQTVTFDSDGGSEVAAQIVAWGDTGVQPADPTKENCWFLGWYYTDPDTQEETAFDFENDPIYWDITLKAKWARLHTLTVTAAENGTVSAEKEQYYEGETVTLDVKPATGYVLNALTYTVDYGGGLSYQPPQTITADENGVYAFAMPEGNATVRATFEQPVFGTPDFKLPANLTTIAESAFEGITDMTVVDAKSCTSIGKHAFKGCTGLTQIKLPKDCAIDADAFDGCSKVYVFAPTGGTTESYCNDPARKNLIFVDEEETLSSITTPSGPVYIF